VDRKARREIPVDHLDLKALLAAMVPKAHLGRRVK
jgi:hypothetical protein